MEGNKVVFCVLVAHLTQVLNTAKWKDPAKVAAVDPPAVKKGKRIVAAPVMDVITTDSTK